MNKSTVRITVSLILAFLAFLPARLPGQDETGPALTKVAIFSDPGDEIEMKRLSEMTVNAASETFHRCGRFYPIERYKTAAMELQISGGSGDERYKKAAALLKCDLLVLIAVRRGPERVFAAMKIIPLSDRYKSLAREIQFETKVPLGIPLKMARELAFFHRNIPLEAKIIAEENGNVLLNAGQWHGLKPGEFRLRDGTAVSIHQTGRFTSLAGVPGPAVQGDTIQINVYPDTTGEIKDIENRLRRIIDRRYALHPSYGTTEDRFMTAMLLYNFTVGVIFPGYGTYLSVNSIAREDNPAYGSIILTFGLVFTHLTLTESLTGYETNFFPWIKDSDKTDSMQRFHIFLWAALPLTLTASFLDQLAHSLAASENTPPFLMNGDEAAAVLSLFIPGGGLFYKGHRLMGWGYYFTEMFLAGYGMYYWGSGTEYIYTYAALGVVKLIEIAHAYLTDFNYDFYRREMDRPAPSYSVTAGMEPVNGRPVYRLGMAFSF